MKKILFMILLFCLPLVAAAQQQEQKYYMYNIGRGGSSGST